jgi:hypothetical protein
VVIVCKINGNEEWENPKEEMQDKTKERECERCWAKRPVTSKVAPRERARWKSTRPVGTVDGGLPILLVGPIEIKGDPAVLDLSKEPMRIWGQYLISSRVKLRTESEPLKKRW